MIDPNAITTVRVGQLAEEIWSGTDNLPHEVGTNLRRGTVADLASYIAGIIDASAGLAFNPLSISDGQTLPSTTENEWIIVGAGTYLQTGGFPDVVCTDEINIVLSNGISWSLGFGIAIDGIDTSQFVKLTTNQTIDGVKTFVQPITFANESKVGEGSIGGISLICSIAKELNWKEGVLRSYNQSDANSKANPIIGESPITYIGQEFAGLDNFSNPDPITATIAIELVGDLLEMNNVFNYENSNYRLYLYDVDDNILGIGKYGGVTYNDVDLSVLELYDVEMIKIGSTINAIVRIVGREYDINTLATIEEVGRIAIPYTGTTQPITGDLEFGDSDRKIFRDYTEISEKIVSFDLLESGAQIRTKDTSTNFETSLQAKYDGVHVYSDSPYSKGLYSNQDFSANITDLDYTQKIYVDNAIASGVSGAELTANKNQNNGYCGLDSGGKVPIANLPTTLLKYQGVWNASTNTPTLTNPDTTKIGNVYNVGVAGTQFGIDFKLGDWLIYNASGVAEKSDNSDDVVSVNGQTGVVNLTTSNVSEGSNLYFTTARVLSTLLNGLSLATGGAIVSTDSVLTAFGKLQKQITDAISELFWTKTGDDIRNNNTGNVEMKMNDAKQVSFLNFNNTLQSRITEDGSYQIFGNGGIFGNGAGCIITFANRVFNFASYADGLGRYIFNPIYLSNTTGIVDVIGFQNKTINPTSGNAVFNFLDIDPIINQSGGANGITRAIYINPTLTSAADFRALEITGGKVIIPNATASNEAVNLGQISDRIAYKSKATYALMIADGTPIVPTIYSVTNDENKSYSRSTYLWKPDGKREWIATTPDN